MNVITFLFTVRGSKIGKTSPTTNGNMLQSTIGLAQCGDFVSVKRAAQIMLGTCNRPDVYVAIQPFGCHDGQREVFR